MDTQILIEFLAGGGAAASLILSIFKDLINSLPARWSNTIKHLVLFGICLVIAAAITASSLLPENVWVVAAGVWAAAVALYEFLFKSLWKQTINGNV